MIYTPLTNKAIRIAYGAHHGQTDKAGLPYICHPLHLAEQMDDEASTCVALLHDVIEDTTMTAKDLRGAGFPDEIVDTVVLLTRETGTLYADYIRKLSVDPIARKVKRADLEHNSDTTRLCKTGTDMSGLLDRYAKAKAILDEAEAHV